MEILGPADFDSTHLRRKGTWAVDFHADWCPFCHQFLPEFEALAGRSELKLAIGDMTDLNSDLWERFELEVVPTLIAFRDGLPIFRRDGRRSEGLFPRDVRDLLAAVSGEDPVPRTDSDIRPQGPQRPPRSE